MEEPTVIIGSGVSGITTGLALQCLGVETKIYTAHTYSGVSDKNNHPEFSSLFPAASVIPHSVYSDQLEELFKNSQSFFYDLLEANLSGLCLHKHYEVFEFERERPPYCNWMHNLQPIANDANLPRPNDEISLFGWKFNCIFTDWPHYFSALIQLYKKSGGTIINQQVESSDIPAIEANTIINCSGIGSAKLFDDPTEKQIISWGQLIRKRKAPTFSTEGGKAISYNYTPKASVYSDNNGNACDVYCYPNNEGWVLGGSRQTMEIGKANQHNISHPGKTYTIDGQQIPAPMIDLNAKILHKLTGRTLSPKDKLSTSAGYRYVRSYSNGLRLEKEQLGNKIIYHNYGHGGAGVTLSWGCAFKIASQIRNTNINDVSSLVLNNIESLQNSC